MNRCRIIAAVAVVLFSAGLCSADSLVITYRSGKTQTVTLDEPSTTINSWQFVAGTTATAPQAVPQQHTAPQEVPKAANAKADATSPEKPAEKKSNVRFQWNAPPIRE